MYNDPTKPNQCGYQAMLVAAGKTPSEHNIQTVDGKQCLGSYALQKLQMSGGASCMIIYARCRKPRVCSIFVLLRASNPSKPQPLFLVGGGGRGVACCLVAMAKKPKA